jgi:tetratricopeptide (TPR) repeat protein
MAPPGHYQSMAREADFRSRLEASLHELTQDPPPPGPCSGTLVAPRLSATYVALAEARSGLGDSVGAADAYRRAGACSPRVARLQGDLCLELANLGRVAEARAAARRGLAIDRDDFSSNSCLAQIDYVAERWPDAVPRIRFLVTHAEDADLATYWEILLWLAGRRSGIAAPELVSRDLATDWPTPILEYLRGRATEASLRDALTKVADPLRRRERLCEALYYVGQGRLAAGDAATARQYLAAAVNLKVLYFTEHHLAVAALARLRIPLSGPVRAGPAPCPARRTCSS